MNNNTTEDYVSFEVAKLLKEKGFSAYCTSLYTEEGKQNDVGNYNGTDDDKYISYSRPTHALTIKWIRENFYLDISTRYISWPHLNEEKWTPYVDTMIKYKKGRKDRESMMIMMANEESQYLATEAALLYTLKNLIP